MGTTLTKEQRNASQVFTDILKKYGKKVDEEELKRVLLWASKADPSINSTNIYTPEVWDNIGVDLWDCATKNAKVAATLLSPWRFIFETLKVLISSQVKEAEGAPSAHPSLPLSADSAVRSKVQPAAAAPAVLLPDNSDDDLDNPFDPINPEKELDLYLPEPPGKWEL